MAEALNAEKAWSELNDLLRQLQTKIAEAANTIRYGPHHQRMDQGHLDKFTHSSYFCFCLNRCSSCGLRHPRKPTGRPHFAARQCNTCKIRHTAREVSWDKCRGIRMQINLDISRFCGGAYVGRHLGGNNSVWIAMEIFGIDGRQSVGHHGMGKLSERCSLPFAAQFARRAV